MLIFKLFLPVNYKILTYIYADECLVENCCITKAYLNGTRNFDIVTLPYLFDAACGEG